MKFLKFLAKRGPLLSVLYVAVPKALAAAGLAVLAAKAQTLLGLFDPGSTPQAVTEGITAAIAGVGAAYKTIVTFANFWKNTLRPYLSGNVAPVIVVLLGVAGLSACSGCGTLPQPIPCSGEKPCPDAICLPTGTWFCPPATTPAEPYDCANPPASKLKGLVRVKHPVQGRYIAVLKNRVRGARTALEARAQGVEVEAVAARFSALKDVTALRSIGALVARTDPKTAMALAQDPAVAYVQEVGRFHAVGEPWHLDRIDQKNLPLDGVFAPGVTGKGVDLFVIDTGCPSTDLKTCRQDHPEFGPRLVPESFTAVVYQGVYDGQGHGTFCMGEAAGKTWGVLKEALVHSARVLDANGSGTTDGVIQGVDFMRAFKEANPLRLVVGSMSLGGDPDPSLDQAICNAVDAGIPVAVAAGNDSANAYNSSPARVKQAITAGASDKGDHIAYFSNFGPGVDVMAPGVDVTSTTPDGGSVSGWSGTSMATPIVAAVAGACLELHPEYTPAQVEDCVKSTATPGKIGDAPADTTQALVYLKKE